MVNMTMIISSAKQSLEKEKSGGVDNIQAELIQAGGDAAMIAHSSQTRTVGKTDQFLHARWWLYKPILDAHPLTHFGQTKVWDEDGRDAAYSFSLLHFSFATLCLCLELTTCFPH